MKKKTMYDKYMKYLQTKVFQVESLKFKIINKLFPNSYNFCEKRVKKSFDKKIKKTNGEEQKQLITNMSKYHILKIRKEKNRRENINYHFDMDKPYETLHWLNNNKQIHKKGLRKNAINVLISLAVLITSSITNTFGPITNIVLFLSITNLVLQSVSAFINVNCVLLQNYNIERVQKYIDGPYQKRKKKLRQKAIEYSDTTKKVAEVIRKNDEIPSIEEVLNSLTTSEDAKRLLELVNKEIAYRQSKQIEPKGQTMVEKKI